MTRTHLVRIIALATAYRDTAWDDMLNRKITHSTFRMRVLRADHIRMRAQVRLEFQAGMGKRTHAMVESIDAMLERSNQ